MIQTFLSKDPDHIKHFLENSTGENIEDDVILGLQYLKEIKTVDQIPPDFLESFSDQVLLQTKSKDAQNIARSVLKPSEFLGKFPDRRTLELNKMSVLALVSLINNNNGYTEFFINLINNPEVCVGQFVPTIEHDVQFEAISRLDGHLWQCQNGHIYSIIDCGQPRTESTCPDCHTRIGGLDYNPQTGNVRVERPTEDLSKHGLKLHETLPSPEGLRKLSSLELNVARAMMNVCLLAGCLLEKTKVVNLLHAHESSEKIERILINNTDQIIRTIARKLGRSEDDALLLLHIMISKRQKNPSAIYNLQSLDGRVAWEDQLKVELRDVLSVLDSEKARFLELVAEDQGAEQSVLDQVLKGSSHHLDALLQVIYFLI